MQFFFAADRDNARLSGRYDLLSRPAMRLLLQRMRQRADEAELPITVCAARRRGVRWRRSRSSPLVIAGYPCRPRASRRSSC
jgi:hypothetical protein